MLDSDASRFSWTSPGVRNPDFPQNYIQHIRENIGKVDIILVSTHAAIRNAFVASELRFTLVYPTPDQKDDYLIRFRERGSTPEFVEMMSQSWTPFLTELIYQGGCYHHILQKGEYLADIFPILRLPI